jgi:anhydro-N-acetylmuramic acid kinase
VIVASVASGTSVDGLDVGVVDLTRDPEQPDQLVVTLLDFRTAPWPDSLGADVLALLPPATTTAEQICSIDQRLGQAAAQAVSEALEQSGAEADLVVAPGQTIYHDVRDGVCHGTLQVGQPSWIAERSGLPVVSDLRARDVAAGGHGAPLASTLDALWLSGPGGPRAALNLGGIANVTVVGDVGTAPMAWDTGPANCLIDVAVTRASEGRENFDEDGRRARAGRVRPELLDRLLAHPHYEAVPPVSTGREVFSASYLERVLHGLADVSADDLVATVTELTAVTVARAVSAHDVSEVVASGGGVRNPALMEALRRQLDGVPLVTTDDRGLPSDAKEAVLWALLGWLSWHGLPGATTATGAREQRVLGRFSPGRGPLSLPEPSTTPVRRLRLRTRDRSLAGRPT